MKFTSALLLTALLTSQTTFAGDNVGGTGTGAYVTGGINSSRDTVSSRGGVGGTSTGSIGISAIRSGGSIGTGDTSVYGSKGYKPLVGGAGMASDTTGGHNTRSLMGGIGTTSAVPGGIGNGVNTSKAPGNP